MSNIRETTTIHSQPTTNTTFTTTEVFSAQPQQQFTTATYPQVLNPIQPQQQFTTVTTYPAGTIPNQQFLQQMPVATVVPVVQQMPPPVIIKETTTPLIVQEVVQELNIPEQEEKPFLERAKETMQPYTDMAKETLHDAKETLHGVGESLGLVQPAQKIEGSLSEIQDVRKNMGKTKMEQPHTQKSFVDMAVETWNEAGEKMVPYTEIAKDTFYDAKETLHEVGEKIGIVYPRQKIEGPLAEIQDIRKSKGLPRMEQPLWKPMDEMTYTEKTKETLMEARESINQFSENMVPYAEMAKETLHEVGEKIGIVYPRQKIEGPLAEIQDVRKSMGKTKMEQPYEKTFSEKAKESIVPITEKAKETLQQAGEKVVSNLSKPTQPNLNEVRPPVDLKDVQLDMGWLDQKPEQPIVGQLIVEQPIVGQLIVEQPLTEKEVIDTWNETEEMIELGKQMGFFGAPLAQTPEIQNQNLGFQHQQQQIPSQNLLFQQQQTLNQNLGLQQQEQQHFQQQQQQNFQQQQTLNQNLGFQQQEQQFPNPIQQANERMEMFAEKARQKMARFTEVQAGAQNLSPLSGLEGGKGTIGTERIVVTETTKVLPA